MWETGDNRRFTVDFRLILASGDGPARLACDKGTDSLATYTSHRLSTSSGTIYLINASASQLFVFTYFFGQIVCEFVHHIHQ